MALSIKHKFQSAKADGTDTTVVQPSNWNDDHTLTCAGNVLLGRLSAGSGPVEELTASAAATALNVVSKAGDVMAGPLTLSGNPSSALHAAPKQYVDGFTPSTRQIIAGTGLSGGGDLTADRTLSIGAGGITPTMLAQPFTAKGGVNLSGSSIDVTGIPAWARRIDVSVSGVSLSATGSLLLQIGGASGVSTSGYASTSNFLTSGNFIGGVTATNGFVVNSVTASVNLTGNITLTNVSANAWVMSFAGFVEGAGLVTNVVAGGRVALGEALTQLRIASTAADSFDAGSIHVFYQ